VVDAAQDNPLLAEEEKKKGSIVVMLAAVAGLSLAAVGIGYMVGGMIRAQSTAGGSATTTDPAAEKAAKAAGHGETKAEGDHGGGDHGAAGGAGATIIMEPIIVTLPKSNNSWLRLETAVVVGEGKASPNEAARAQILAQVSAYLRTTDMGQVYGPSGYLHLHEDILDIARRVTDGAVSEVLILSLVAE
jgi:flagellar FliL protein